MLVKWDMEVDMRCDLWSPDIIDGAHLDGSKRVLKAVVRSNNMVSRSRYRHLIRN